MFSSHRHTNNIVLLVPAARGAEVLLGCFEVTFPCGERCGWVSFTGRLVL